MTQDWHISRLVTPPHSEHERISEEVFPEDACIWRICSRLCKRPCLAPGVSVSRAAMISRLR
jgi:hypothetical protein